MRIRIRKEGVIGAKRVDAKCEINDIIIKENLLNPEQESIAVFFKGHDSSGILNMNDREAEDLVSALSGSLRLVKKSKKIKG